MRKMKYLMSVGVLSISVLYLGTTTAAAETIDVMQICKPVQGWGSWTESISDGSCKATITYNDRHNACVIKAECHNPRSQTPWNSYNYSSKYFSTCAYQPNRAYDLLLMNNNGKVQSQKNNSNYCASSSRSYPAVGFSEWQGHTTMGRFELGENINQYGLDIKPLGYNSASQLDGYGANMNEVIGTETTMTVTEEMFQ